LLLLALCCHADAVADAIHAAYYAAALRYAMMPRAVIISPRAVLMLDAAYMAPPGVFDAVIHCCHLRHAMPLMIRLPCHCCYAYLFF